MWSDDLSVSEAEFSQHAINTLENVIWARPLVTHFNNRGGLKAENKSLLFEARFALELHQAGVTADYEYLTGVGKSSVDFHFNNRRDWLVEVVSICESDAVKRATHEEDGFSIMLLMSNSDDPTQSPEGEMIKAMEKIGDKVCDNKKRPTKFPVPKDAFHLIVVDMRGYEGRGHWLDHTVYHHECKQIAWGMQGKYQEDSYMHYEWRDASGYKQPIKGVFEKSNTQRYATLLQERVHFLCFVHERAYREGEIGNVAFFTPNLNLFPNVEAAKKAFDSFPLTPQPVRET